MRLVLSFHVRVGRKAKAHISPSMLNGVTAGLRVYFTHFSPLWVVFLNGASRVGYPNPPPIVPAVSKSHREVKGAGWDMQVFICSSLCLQGSSNTTYLCSRQAYHCLLLRSQGGDIIRLKDSTIFHSILSQMEGRLHAQTHTLSVYSAVTHTLKAQNRYEINVWAVRGQQRENQNRFSP